jgi:hypothetical protein
VVQEEDRTSITPGPSVHRSVSLKAGGHASSLRSASGTPGPSDIHLGREELLALLGIPAHLTERDKNHSLQDYYAKYQACLKAQQLLDKSSAEGKWPGKKPTSTEIVELFVSKSMWHSHFKHAFSNINNHPSMVKWLEGGEEGPTNLEAWGFEKAHATYNFSDLFSYLDDARKDGKNRKGKKGGKGKKKEIEGEDDDGETKKGRKKKSKKL